MATPTAVALLAAQEPVFLTDATGTPTGDLTIADLLALGLTPGADSDPLTAAEREFLLAGESFVAADLPLTLVAGHTVYFQSQKRYALLAAYPFRTPQQRKGRPSFIEAADQAHWGFFRLAFTTRLEGPMDIRHLRNAEATGQHVVMLLAPCDWVRERFATPAEWRHYLQQKVDGYKPNGERGYIPTPYHEEDGA